MAMRGTPEVMLVGALSPQVTVLPGRLEARDRSGARILIGAPTIARMISVSAIHCVLSLTYQCFMTDERNRSTGQ
jgi:hypothetical protein